MTGKLQLQINLNHDLNDGRDCVWLMKIQSETLQFSFGFSF